MRRSMPLTIGIFFIGFLVLGLITLGAGLDVLWKSHQANTWPIVQGTVLDRKLVKYDVSNITFHEVKVSYTYSVEGTRYESDSFAFGYRGSSDFEVHQKIFAELYPGKPIRVRYNSSKPNEAVLAVNNSVPSLLIFGIIWTVFTVGFFSFLLFCGSWSNEQIDK